MAIEKFNRKPWHDNPNHAGRHSHEMRKQAADQELEDYLAGLSYVELIDLAAQIHDWDGQMDRLRRRGAIDTPSQTDPSSTGKTHDPRP